MNNLLFVVIVIVGLGICAQAMPTVRQVAEEGLTQLVMDITTIQPENQDEEIAESNTPLPILLEAVPMSRDLTNGDKMDMANGDEEDMEGAETVVFRPLFRYRQVSRRRAQEASRRRFTRYTHRRRFRPYYYYY